MDFLNNETEEHFQMSTINTLLSLECRQFLHFTIISVKEDTASSVPTSDAQIL